MLEINRRYVFDEAGEPIAVQIPISQFEALLEVVPQGNDVVVTDDNFSQSQEALQQAVDVGLEALEKGEYDDYDKSGLNHLFSRIKQNGRSSREHQA